MGAAAQGAAGAGAGTAVDPGFRSGSGAAGSGAAGIFPLSEVHRGLKGEALTVFEGVVPERMEVEILGVIRDSLGPGRDMILARLGGKKAEYTGVVAGMSGSPVYINGRLLGALSYRIGQFSKDPIAGITPIEEMFEAGDTPGPVLRAMGSERASSEAGGKADMQASTEAAGSRGNMQAIETPLVFGGFSAEAVERFGGGFRSMGMTPVSGLGGRDAGTKQPEPLVPGSAVSAILVDGDLSVTGTCTVTYVDADRLLACGHPITQYGAVEMPMSKAEVVATLASPLNAFKIVNATEVVGAFTQDRASAIVGRLGKRARMIPVEIQVVPQSAAAGVGTGRTFHLQVLDNRQLTPQAMMVSVYQTLQQTNAAAAETSYSLTGEIGLAERTEDGSAGRPLPGVVMRSLLTPGDFNSGAISTALLVGNRFDRVYENAREQPVVTGLRLRVEVIPERKTAEIVAARMDRTEVRAGETAEVEVTLHPFQAPARILRSTIKLPESLAPGPVRVVVSDGGTLDRLTASHNPGQHVQGLLDSVLGANSLHANDRVYVTLLDRTAQAVLGSGPLQAVPLSMANVLEPTGETGKLQLTGESVTEAGSMETGYALTGFQVLDLTIR